MVVFEEEAVQADGARRHVAARGVGTGPVVHVLEHHRTGQRSAFRHGEPVGRRPCAGHVGGERVADGRCGHGGEEGIRRHVDDAHLTGLAMLKDLFHVRCCGQIIQGERFSRAA